MRFEEALKAMREGKKVKSKYTPVLWLEDGELWHDEDWVTFNYPYVSTGDILSEDWEIVE